jgi:hypothetical protein
MRYQPSSTSYTVWVRHGIKQQLSTALAKSVGRSFAMSDDFWTLNREEVELILAAASP